MYSKDIERKAMISLLKLTRDNVTSSSILAKESRISASVIRNLMTKFHEDGLICLQGNLINVSAIQRIKIVIKSLTFNQDFENVSRELNWSEFENIVAMVFEENDYSVLKRLRFKSQGRRWEIDVYAHKRPHIILVECKHWQRGFTSSTIKKTIIDHLTKIQAFIKVLPDMKKHIKIINWHQATLLPIVVSLTKGPFDFYEGVPFVSVHKLPSFISDLSAHIYYLKTFKKTFT